MNNITNMANMANATTIVSVVENMKIMELILAVPLCLILIVITFYCTKENNKCCVKNNKVLPYKCSDIPANSQ